MEHIFKETKTEMDFHSRSDISFITHIHEDIELIYVRRGSCTAFCDGKKYGLQSGSFFLVKPYQVHRYDNCEQGDYIVLVINPKRLFRYASVIVGSVAESPLLPEQDGGDIPQLLETALKDFREYGQCGIVDGLLTALFGKLIRVYSFTKSKPHSDTASQILEYCLAHYTENINIQSIANALNISRSLVSHTFSDCFDINFCSYINSLRLFHATEILKSSSVSITQAALLSGFSNLRTFNRAFLKQYGVAPSVYRKQN